MTDFSNRTSPYKVIATQNISVGGDQRITTGKIYVLFPYTHYVAFVDDIGDIFKLSHDETGYLGIFYDHVNNVFEEIE